MNKIIETALPLTEINNAAIREKAGKTGHPANLHMWWGRSPEASSLAALSAAVMDYSKETASEDMALLAKMVSGDKDSLEAMRGRLNERGSLPTVWDAFAGFGGIPIAAGKLGSKAVDGADVELMLEVSVSAPSGIPSSTVRTVSENCRTLKIQNFGFEDN